jgi:ribosomal protein S18
MKSNSLNTNANFSRERSSSTTLGRDRTNTSKKPEDQGLKKSNAKTPFSGNEKSNNKNRSFSRRQVLSVSQLLVRLQKQKQRQLNQKKRQKPVKPIIPPKSLVIILKDKPEKAIYNRRIIDYKHCGLLQRYIGLGGKILPRRQTKLTAKQQRYVAKTIKSARIMGLLPFVTKERGFFR